MQILGYHIVDGLIVDSEGDECKGMSYLEFLLQPKPDTIRMMYDLDYNVTNLLEMLHLSAGEKMALIAETKVYTPPYHLRWVQGKLFSIKRPKAFAYYADASRYVRYPAEDLALEGSVLANRAKEVGEQVYSVLSGLGLSPTSLVNPARAYEKGQLKWLYAQKREADGDPIKAGIIEEIGREIYGKTWEEYCAGSRR